MAGLSSLPLLPILLLFTASTVSIFVLGQVAIAYLTAYLAAPTEVVTFIDAVDFSVQENESYDRIVSKCQELEDKLRLSRLLREIQRVGDDLREDLNSLLVDGSSSKIRTKTRLLWRPTRQRLEERVRRLDLLRMRFLVVYMGLVAAKGTTSEQTRRDPEKQLTKPAIRPSLPYALTEDIARKPPLRRLTTQAMGHSEERVALPQRQGWAGVVAELQRSPLMHKRHASSERTLPSP